jgi:hypothetical protein
MAKGAFKLFTLGRTVFQSGTMEKTGYELIMGKQNQEEFKINSRKNFNELDFIDPSATIRPGRTGCQRIFTIK